LRCEIGVVTQGKFFDKKAIGTTGFDRFDIEKPIFE
jgi:hypothetical protein